MTIRERMLAVLAGQKPDKIPFFCFSGLMPTGSFERKLRNNGMGLILVTSPVAAETPNISITRRKSEIGEEIIYHTPVGDLSTEIYTGTNRITAPAWPIKSSCLIKDVKDYEPLIYMINDTVYNVDLKEFKLKDQEIGEDGILRAEIMLPYFEAQYLLGLEKWSYEQYDHPKEYLRLLDALDRRCKTLTNIIAEIEYDMVIMIMVGDISDTVSPDSYMNYEVPFYDKAFKILKSKNKKCGIHAHASLLKRQKEVIARINPDYIEAYTPPPYSDLPLSELRKAVGENVTILINFPETIFYGGYEKTKNYTIELLKSDPSYNKMICCTEMAMMGVDDSIRNTFEVGFQAILDAIDTIELKG